MQTKVFNNNDGETAEIEVVDLTGSPKGPVTATQKSLLLIQDVGDDNNNNNNHHHHHNNGNNCSYFSKQDAARRRQHCQQTSTPLYEFDSDEEFEYASMVCADCRDYFPTRQQLLLHREEVHPDQPAHQCLMCYAVFGAFHLLAEHKLGHTEERGSACGVCGKSFTLDEHVAAHARAMHPVEAPVPHQEYRCAKCTTRVFQSAAGLAIHTGRFHSDTLQEDRAFVCPTCSRGYKNRSNLTRHIKKVHPAPDTAPSSQV